MKSLRAILLSLCILAGAGCYFEQPAPAVKKLDSYIHHRVQYERENLRAVAAWYTGSPENARFLLNHNPGLKPNRLEIGETILIPAWLATTYNQLPESFLAAYQPGVIIPRVSPTPTETPTPAPTATRTVVPTRTPFPTRTPRPTRTSLPTRTTAPETSEILIPRPTRTPRPVPPVATRAERDSGIERHTTTVRAVKVTPSSRPAEEWRSEEVVPAYRPTPPPQRTAPRTVVRMGPTLRPAATAVPRPPREISRETPIAIAPGPTLSAEEAGRKKLLENLLDEIGE